MEFLEGTLDMLILQAVSPRPSHGYGVLSPIQQLSKGRLETRQGLLDPAPHRLEHRGWIASEWGELENQARRDTTASGQRAGANCKPMRKTGTA